MCVCVRAHVCMYVGFFPQLDITLSQTLKKRIFYNGGHCLSILCLCISQPEHILLDHLFHYAFYITDPSFVMYSYPSVLFICSFVCFIFLSLPRDQACSKIFPYSTLFNPEAKKLSKIHKYILHNCVLEYLTQPSSILKKF